MIAVPTHTEEAPAALEQQSSYRARILHERAVFDDEVAAVFIHGSEGSDGARPLA